MARRFGEPTIGHAVFGHVDGYPEIYSVAKKSHRQREPRTNDGNAVVRLAQSLSV
jgi:taurine dioxygenase